MRRIIFIILVDLLFGALSLFAQSDTLYISLKDAIEITMKENISIKETEEKIIIQQKNYQKAKAEFLPTLNFSSSYNYNFNSNLARANNSQQIGFSAGWDLWQGGSRFINLNIQKVSQDIAENEQWLMREQKLLEVINAYIELMQAQKSLIVTQEAFQLAKNSYEQTSAMLKVGTAKQIDLIRAEVEISKWESSLISAQNVVENAKNKFFIVMNIEQKPVSLIEPKFKEITLLPLKEYLTNINSPSISISKLSLQKAELNTKTVKSGFYPNISLSASYGWSGNDFQFEKPSLSGGIRLNWSIFDGGLRYIEHKKSKMNEKLAIYNIESTIDEVQSKIETDYREVEVNRAKWISNKRTLELSQKSYEQTFTMYKLGLATSLELFQAQQTLNESKLNEISSYYSIYKSYAKLLSDMGELGKKIANGELFSQ